MRDNDPVPGGNARLHPEVSNPATDDDFAPALAVASNAAHATGYAFIKQLKRDLRQQGIKRNTPDLLALSPGNDPFNSGSEGNWKSARWFAEQLDRFGLRTHGVHMRRIHYRIVSQDPPPLLWGDRPYENTETCWSALNTSSKQARYLKLVDVDLFDDRRNPPPRVFWPEAPDETVIKEPIFTTMLYGAGDLPTLDGPLVVPELHDPTDEWRISDRSMGYRYDPAEVAGFHLELWIEKSTMEDVLLPICERHGITYVPAIGFQSITGTIRMLQRLENFARQARRKPTRIFYVSDFDPAGDSMPPAIARQIEFWLRELSANFDIKLHSLALTAEQVLQYRLPPIPIKEGDKRQNHFKERYGVEGATELDALEALHPGEMKRIVETAIRPYFDQTLRQRLQKAADTADRMVSAVWSDRRRAYVKRLETIKAKAGTLIDDHRALLAELQRHVEKETAAIALSLQNQIDEAGIPDALAQLNEELWAENKTLSLDLPPRPEPEFDLSDEGGWLFDSSRDYLAQLTFYTARRSGEVWGAA